MLPCEANRPVAGFDLVAADRCQGHGIATLRCSRPRPLRRVPDLSARAVLTSWASADCDQPAFNGGNEPDRLSSRPFAEQTQAGIGGEASRQLRDAENQAVDALNGHREVLDQRVRLLQTKETVDGSEVYALAGRLEPQARTG